MDISPGLVLDVAYIEYLKKKKRSLQALAFVNFYYIALDMMHR